MVGVALHVRDERILANSAQMALLQALDSAWREYSTFLDTVPERKKCDLTSRQDAIIEQTTNLVWSWREKANVRSLRSLNVSVSSQLLENKFYSNGRWRVGNEAETRAIQCIALMALRDQLKGTVISKQEAERFLTVLYVYSNEMGGKELKGRLQQQLLEALNSLRKSKISTSKTVGVFRDAACSVSACPEPFSVASCSGSDAGDPDIDGSDASFGRPV